VLLTIVFHLILFMCDSDSQQFRRHDPRRRKHNLWSGPSKINPITPPLPRVFHNNASRGATNEEIEPCLVQRIQETEERCRASICVWWECWKLTWSLRSQSGQELWTGSCDCVWINQLRRGAYCWGFLASELMSHTLMYGCNAVIYKYN
jgi:hypothetical protein